jgi:hypothetical protein
LAEKEKQHRSTYLINQAVDKEGQTKLHLAANTGNVSKALALINEGIDINLQDVRSISYFQYTNEFQRKTDGQPCTVLLIIAIRTCLRFYLNNQLFKCHFEMNLDLQLWYENNDNFM